MSASIYPANWEKNTLFCAREYIFGQKNPQTTDPSFFQAMFLFASCGSRCCVSGSCGLSTNRLTKDFAPTGLATAGPIRSLLAPLRSISAQNMAVKGTPTQTQMQTKSQVAQIATRFYRHLKRLGCAPGVLWRPLPKEELAINQHPP